jgi:hypothetical protein
VTPEYIPGGDATPVTVTLHNWPADVLTQVTFPVGIKKDNLHPVYQYQATPAVGPVAAFTFPIAGVPITLPPGGWAVLACYQSGTGFRCVTGSITVEGVEEP